MKNKTFDCVEMQHRGAEAVRERLKGMSMEEQLAYWRERTDELRERQRKIKEDSSKEPAS